MATVGATEAQSRFPSSSKSKRKEGTKINESNGSSLMNRSLDLILYCDPMIKSIVISLVVLLFSAIDFSLSGKLGLFDRDIVDFKEKNNALNVYFVKISWFWTLVCIFPISVTTGYLLSGVSIKGVFVSLGRLSVATAVWWILTTFFIHVDQITGVCSAGEDVLDRMSCRKGGHTWIGFDISGHIFLLTYSILVVTEELKALKEIQSLQDVGDDIGDVTSAREHHMHVRDTLKVLKSLSWYFKSLCFCFMFAAFAMLVATSLFFHTFVEKVLGLALGISVWWLTYGFLYPSTILNWTPVPK